MVCFAPAYAQNRFWDNALLDNIHTRSDTAAIGQLLQQSKKLINTNPDSALTLAEKALDASRGIGYVRGTALSLLGMAASLYPKDDYATIKRYVQEATPYCLAAAAEDKMMIPLLYVNQANIFKAQGKADSALHLFYKALQLLEPARPGNPTLLATTYSNIAATLGGAGQYEKVLFYARKAIDLATRLKDTTRLAQNNLNIGHMYTRLKKQDSARYYLHTSIRLHRQLKCMKDVQNAFIIMSATWLDQGNLQMDKACLDSAANADPEKAPENIYLQDNYAYVYYLAKDYEKALTYYQKELAIALRKGIQDGNFEIYYRLALCYHQLGNDALAYQYQKQYIDMADSLTNIAKAGIINTLEVQYRTSEKDKELVQNRLQLALAQAHLSKSNSRTVAIVAGTMILLISMIILFQKQRLQLHKEKAGKQVQRMEQLKAVIDGEEKERSRIGRQLHDDIMVELSIVKMGLNALPILYPGIKHTENYTNLVQQLNHTSQKLRQTAHNLMPDALLIEGLVPAISYFCSNVAKMTGLRIHFQHYGDIPRLPADIEISIYRIIQELVQNIIKHARAAHTLVQLNYREDLLIITVEDDGTGFKVTQQDHENKMGLKSIQTRLKALNGLIDIHERDPHGTSVNISLSTHMLDDKN